MGIKLTIIGCTGSMSGPNSAASCYLLQARAKGEDGQQRTWSILVDLGPGSFGSLWKHLDPQDLDAVLFTHAHADHIGDVVSLYVHNRWFPGGQLAPIDVYGPSNVSQRVQQIDGWATEEELAGVFRFHTVEDQSSFSVGPLVITPFTARHTVEAFGFRVEKAGSTVALTGDTDSCDSMVEMARGADLLLSEAAFTRAETVRGIHLDGARAGQLAAESGARQLVLTHIQPWTDPQLVAAEARSAYKGPLFIAAPGQVYEV